MGRYIDPRTDFGFKRLFGQEDSKEILIHFLFDTLELAHPIQDLSYIPQERLPSYVDDRVTIYDIYCVDTAGNRFIVEMQRNWQANFKERALYYSTFAITHQVEKGDSWGYNLLPVYCISILDFQIVKDSRYRRKVQLVDTEDKSLFYDKLTYLFIELPKFNRPLESLTEPIDRWIYLLKNMPSLYDIPRELEIAPFPKLFHIAEHATLSPEEQLFYEASLKRTRDAHAVLEGMLQRGFEQGLQQGLQQGRRSREREIVEGMLAKGFELPTIAQIIGLSELEIRELLQ